MSDHRAPFLVFALVLCVFAGPGARAHDPGFSTLTVTLAADRIDVSLRLGAADARALGSAPAGPELLLDDVPLAPRSAGTAPDPDGGATLHWEFPSPPARRLAIRFAAISALPVGHKQLVRVLDPDVGLIGSRVVDANSATPIFAVRILARPTHPPRDLGCCDGGDYGALHAQVGQPSGPVS